MDIGNGVTANGRQFSSSVSGPDSLDEVNSSVNGAGTYQEGMEQPSPVSEVSPDHQREDAGLVKEGNAENLSSSAGNDEHPIEPSHGDVDEQRSEEEQDLAVQIIDLEVLPTDSDDGVRHHIDQIGDKLNIKHVMGCLRLQADLLRVGGNVVATDASQLVKVQELQFEVIKLCDAVSLMLQNDQSGANNILEKLKIAYLYLQDGFPDFAKTDIEVISKDVKSMEEATKKCLGKIKAAKSSEQTVLELVQSKKVERGRKVASLLEEIKGIKAKLGTERNEPVLPITASDPLPNGSEPRHPTWWQMAYDIGVNALLQMGCQAVRELTGFHSPKLGILSDLTDNQIVISAIWHRKPNQTLRDERESQADNTILRTALTFVAPAVTIFAITSGASRRMVLEIGCGFGIPAVCLYFKGVSPTPPIVIDMTKEDLAFFKRVSIIGVVLGMGGCICSKRNDEVFVRTYAKGLRILQKILQIKKTSLDGLGPFSCGVGFFIITCIAKRRPSFVPPIVKKYLIKTESDPRPEEKAKPSHPNVDELKELEEELRDKREALTKAVDNVYISLLAIMVIEKSLPLLDDITVVLDYATTLVNNWFKECKEIVEPSMQQNIDRAEGLSAEDKRKYWDSLFFKKEVKGYYERWRALQVFCERNRPSLKSTRQRAESHYTENLYPRDAVKKAWELAAEEPDEDIRGLVEERRQWLMAKAGCGGLIETVVPFKVKNGRIEV